jgi:dTDP-glucose 4,6-dehydratase
MRRVLVTGGAGFIGSNLVSMLISTSEGPISVTVFDSLTYAADLENLPKSDAIKIVIGDVRDFELLSNEIAQVEEVFHLAAESHVDRSIDSSRIFLETNVLGTLNVLEAVRKHDKRLVLVSTDEVYGSLKEGFADENSPLQPSSPYSASKASADLLALAFNKTYNTNVVITRCTNNYGPNQYPEKLIPVIIQNALNNKPIPIYGDGKNVRDWIHVLDHCAGLLLAMEKGTPGQIYNFGDADQLSNLHLTSLILEYLDDSKSQIKFVSDRPGHDFRYAVNTDKSQEILGWHPQRRIEQTLPETIEHYKKKFLN